MTLWYSVRSAADVSEQRVKELEAGFECALDALDEVCLSNVLLEPILTL